MSLPRALSGEMYTTWVWSWAVPAGAMSWLMDQRKAARVLPDPVGAAMSVSRPRAISPQPAACGGVGLPKRSRNQSRTRG